MDRKGYSSRGRSSSHYSSSSRTPSYGGSHSRYETSSRDYRDSSYASRGGHHTSSSMSSDRYHGSSSSSSSRYAPDDRYRSSSSSGYASSSSRPDDRYRDTSASYRGPSSHYGEPVYESRSYDRHPPERSSGSYKRPYPPAEEPRSYSARPEPRYRYEERAPRLSPARAAYEPPPPPRSSFRTPRRALRGSGIRGRGGSRMIRGRSAIMRSSDTRPRRGLSRGSIVKRAQIIRRQREEALAEAEKAVQEITGDDESEVAAKKRRTSESEASSAQVKEEPKDDADKLSDTKGEGDASKPATAKVVKVTGTRGGTLPYIKLVCPHCSYRCLTFKDYTHHLSGSRHVSALHNVSMRMKLYLQKLRERQRRDQADIDKLEENQSEAESNFCLPCKLYYKNSKNSHEESKIHKVIVEYLNPRCKNCCISFHNRLMYEKHLASINHIRKLASAEIPTDAKKEKKDEGEEEMSMDKFMTVDTVGSVDDESADAAGKKSAATKAAVSKIPGAVGELYVERVDVYFCRLCERYLARTNPLEKAIGLHCRGPTHKRNYRTKHGAGDKQEAADPTIQDETKSEEGDGQKKAEENKQKSTDPGNTDVPSNDSADAKKDEQIWDDVYKDLSDLGDIAEGDDQKSQGDEETQQERFNRLKNSSEKSAAGEKPVNGDTEEK